MFSEPLRLHFPKLGFCVETVSLLEPSNGMQKIFNHRIKITEGIHF